MRKGDPDAAARIVSGLKTMRIRHLQSCGADRRAGGPRPRRRRRTDAFGSRPAFGCSRAPPIAQPQREAIALSGNNRAARQADAQARERALQKMQQQWPEVVESFSKTVRLGRNGTLDLENFAGNIIITAGREDDVRIEA